MDFTRTSFSQLIGDNFVTDFDCLVRLFKVTLFATSGTDIATYVLSTNYRFGINIYAFSATKKVSTKVICFFSNTENQYFVYVFRCDSNFARLWISILSKKIISWVELCLAKVYFLYIRKLLGGWYKSIYWKELRFCVNKTVLSTFFAAPHSTRVWSPFWKLVFMHSKVENSNYALSILAYHITYFLRVHFSALKLIIKQFSNKLVGTGEKRWRETKNALY